MFGDKQFDNVGYPTPESTPEETTCLMLQVPASAAWWSIYAGLLQTLADETAWQQFEGGMSPEDAAQVAAKIARDALLLASQTNECSAIVPAPYWDQPTADDIDDQFPPSLQPWYGEIVALPAAGLRAEAAEEELTFLENLTIWAIAAFGVYAGQVGAAIAFVPVAKRFVLAFKQHDLGGVVRVLVDFLEVAEIDTYGVGDQIKRATVVMPDDDEEHTLYVEMSDKVNPAVDGDPQIIVIRKELSEEEVTPSNTRYNPDTDKVQYSPDGGETWHDAPELDPRHADTFRYPALTTPDARCDAAANKVKWLKDFLDDSTDALCAGAQAFQIANIALGFWNVITGGTSTLLELIVGVGSAVTEVGCSALTAAFTEDEYDALNCIFYCRAQGNGSVTADDLEKIYADVTAQLNTTAALVVNLILSVQGEVGLSNAGTVGNQTGDCSACECEHCFEIDFTVIDGTAYGWNIQGGTWSSGVGWSGENQPPNSLSDVYGYWYFGEVLSVSKIQMDYTKTNGSGFSDVNRLNALNPATGYGTTTVAQNSFNSLGANLTKELTVNADLAGMGCDINSGTSSGPAILLRMRVFYVGDPPAGWSDNC